MKHFALLIQQLDQTNKTGEKVEALKEFFSTASDKDKVWALALFTGRRPKRPVNTTRVREWIAEEAGIPQWLFEDSYHVVGDLAETISLILPDTQGNSGLSLDHWMNVLLSLEDAGEQQKKQTILKALGQLNRTEKFIFTKLITGSFRIGVSQNLVIRALAGVNQVDMSSIAYRLTGKWDPRHISYRDLVVDADHKEDHSKPYPFFLAYPIDGEIETLGDPSQWEAEWKWDGIRGQLVFRNDALYTWTRGNELVTEKFPELGSLTGIIPPGTVMDGEIIPFRDEKILPFTLLQTRIGRKNLSKKILSSVPVCFFAFDLLEWEDRDIRDKPLSYRRELLKKLLLDIKPYWAVRLLQDIPFESWEELAAVRQRSREYLAEGLMIKKLDSPYEAGRKKGNWWKWKIEPYTVDGVMIYAMKGHGRRADLFSDYTFAVWDREKLVPFAKAYSGLTDAEMKEVDIFVKRNTLERFGPVRTVRPELVFEIAFEGINASARHKSGIALRFPRIKRWRRDKKPEDANTLDDLKALLPENFS